MHFVDVLRGYVRLEGAALAAWEARSEAAWKASRTARGKQTCVATGMVAAGLANLRWRRCGGSNSLRDLIMFFGSTTKRAVVLRTEALRQKLALCQDRTHGSCKK